jgi:hypothetical protein
VLAEREGKQAQFRIPAAMLWSADAEDDSSRPEP